MGKLGIAMLTGLVVAVMCEPSGAWEFRMTGEYVWNWERCSQIGEEGFFGEWDLDNDNPDLAGGTGVVGCENFNFWTGYRVMEWTTTGTNLTSSHDVQLQSQYMLIKPQIRLNRATRIRASLRIGGYRLPERFLPEETAAFGVNTVNGWVGALIGAAIDYRAHWTSQIAGDIGNNYWPGKTGGTYGMDWQSIVQGGYMNQAVASQYLNSELGGTNVGFSSIYVETLWGTVQTPWGIIAFGKRPAPVGMGMMLDGSEMSSESLALVVPYGPLTFVAFGYPSRRNDPLTLSGLLYGDSWNPLDTRNNRDPELGCIVRYNAGPLETGIFFDYISTHDDQGGVLPGAPQGPYYRARDTKDWIGIAWLKFNNGRFFVNAEVDHYDRIRKRTRRLPQYYEDWRCVVETGFVTGPLKLSLLYAYATGPDRRAGRLIDRQGSFENGVLLGNSTVFEPYSNLMVLSYGTGAGAIGIFDRKGNFMDAAGMGARIDYAVAANLNVYMSGFWAQRAGHGYGWGVHRPLFNWNVMTPGATQAEGYTSMDNPANLPVRAWSLFGANTRYNWNDATASARAAPAIPDNDLGWELGAGFDWKLLEGFNIRADFSLWRPGKWFNYACIDRSVVGWQQDHDQDTNWGINPDRTIDPIFYHKIQLKMSF